MNTTQFAIALAAVYLAGGASGFLLQRWIIGAKMLKALNEGMAQMKAAVDDLVSDRSRVSDDLDGLTEAARSLNKKVAEMNAGSTSAQHWGN